MDNPFETRATSDQGRANHALWLEHARAENRRDLIFFPVRDGRFTGERVYFDVSELARQIPAAKRLLEATPA
jgi:hypothetical protein